MALLPKLLVSIFWNLPKILAHLNMRKISFNTYPCFRTIFLISSIVTLLVLPSILSCFCSLSMSESWLVFAISSSILSRPQKEDIVLDKLLLLKLTKIKWKIKKNFVIRNILSGFENIYQIQQMWCNTISYNSILT